MSTQIFVNLPVKDLDRSVRFFTDENATCMIIGENIFAMLLVEGYFKTFTNKALCDAKQSTEAIVALSAENRAKVDEIVAKAVAAGASTPRAAQDYGFMYQHGFEDLDGHLWEYFYMDPNASPHG